MVINAPSAVSAENNAISVILRTLVRSFVCDNTVACFLASMLAS